ncbi:hypothetical protein Q0812_04225 [Brevundimonas sp. 2R-24]|uniref:Uncharacterized protein n=1 Tax=Peiella sedimenti TaxID=3061083 RepID=A0ABT8SKX4_9CAUL|nr:hypothetical protein [Caulobacteraceae bacterium XZ-24]
MRYQAKIIIEIDENENGPADGATGPLAALMSAIQAEYPQAKLEVQRPRSRSRKNSAPVQASQRRINRTGRLHSYDL